MSVRIVRLGSPRTPGEGARIGTVRRPPRGVPKAEFASQDWYDVWFPTLSPSLETMKLGLAATTQAQWNAFSRKYLAEMAAPPARDAIALATREVPGPVLYGFPSGHTRGPCWTLPFGVPVRVLTTPRPGVIVEDAPVA